MGRKLAKNKGQKRLKVPPHISVERNGDITVLVHYWLRNRSTRNLIVTGLGFALSATLVGIAFWGPGTLSTLETVGSVALVLLTLALLSFFYGYLCERYNRTHCELAPNELSVAHKPWPVLQGHRWAREDIKAIELRDQSFTRRGGERYPRFSIVVELKKGEPETFSEGLDRKEDADYIVQELKGWLKS